MTSLSAALYSALRCDLSEHLDPYQLSVMDAGGTWWPDCTVREAQCLMLGVSLLKKFNEEERPSESACNRALEKFLAANNRSKEWRVEFGDLRDEELFHGVAMELYNFWYEEGYSLVSCYEELFMAGGTGPGASRHARGQDLYTKVWDSPLSYAGDHLLNVWETIVSRDPRWKDAFLGCLSRHKPRSVEGNKLGFVNKNVTVARCISTEPTINMWFQLGLGRILEGRLKRFYGIDLANQQEINKALAQTGSEWGLYSTIDLESASDTIAVGLCKEILPRPFYEWLMRLRSPTVALPNKEIAELGMIGTMGNGFTFPLQTVIFSAVVATVYRHLGIPLRKRGTADERSFGVFGDDIVVHRRASQLTYRLLGMLGFTVNQSKSFVEGPFRESCGGDYFNGYPVRGVYIKRLRLSQDFYVAINTLNRWSALTGVRLPRAINWLLANIPEKSVRWVPPDENDDAGVHVPLDKARGIKHLQHGLHAYRRDVSQSDYVVISRPPRGAPTFDHTWEQTLSARKGVERRGYNPAGLYLCFLHGAVRGYRISLRQRKVRYTTERRVTSSWNTLLPRCPVSARWLDWSRWSAAVYDNLPS